MKENPKTLTIESALCDPAEYGERKNERVCPEAGLAIGGLYSVMMLSDGFDAIELPGRIISQSKKRFKRHEVRLALLDHDLDRGPTVTVGSHKGLWRPVRPLINLSQNPVKEGYFLEYSNPMEELQGLENSAPSSSSQIHN